MIGLNDEMDVIETIIKATIANVRGTYQLEYLIITTADIDDHLVMSITDSRIGFRVYEKRELSSLTQDPALKIRTSLVNMVNALDCTYDKRK